MQTGRPKTCETKNGVRRPLPNTVGETVWEICANLPQPPKRKDVIAIAFEREISPGTASGRFNDYRRFHSA